MNRAFLALLAVPLILSLASAAQSDQALPPTKTFYLGFDRNDYPGDETLKTLHNTFSFVGYWLNTPPGATSNSWAGKRKIIQNAGFGFLVVFNGRTYAEIKADGNANHLGSSDAAAAVSSARREGFQAATIIFLDQEEGGRLLAEQRAYIHAWIDAVAAAGFRTGVYCSGISFKEGSGVSVITAEDIHDNAAGRNVSFWVSNDACPPSPGCVFPKETLSPSASGISFADVWQYAQSPRRKKITNQCSASYNPDRNCYPPGAESQRLHVDLNVATSPDPSHGKTQD